MKEKSGVLTWLWEDGPVRNQNEGVRHLDPKISPVPTRLLGILHPTQGAEYPIWNPTWPELDIDEIDKVAKKLEQINRSIVAQFEEINTTVANVPKTSILLGAYFYSLRYDHLKGKKFLSM